MALPTNPLPVHFGPHNLVSKTRLLANRGILQLADSPSHDSQVEKMINYETIVTYDQPVDFKQFFQCCGLSAQPYIHKDCRIVKAPDVDKWTFLMSMGIITLKSSSGTITTFCKYLVYVTLHILSPYVW
jgi:hypothetical protein